MSDEQREFWTRIFEKVAAEKSQLFVYHEQAAELAALLREPVVVLTGEQIDAIETASRQLDCGYGATIRVLRDLVDQLKPAPPVVWTDVGCNSVAELGPYSLCIHGGKQPFNWYLSRSENGLPMQQGDADTLADAKRACEAAARKLQGT